MEKPSWKERVLKGKKLDEDDGVYVKVKNFRKYVDENFDPLIDAEGNELYEKEVVSKLEPAEQKMIRLLFQGAIESAKGSR